MAILLVAQSARLLAQSAHRAGLQVDTLDYFADADTRQFARETRVLNPGPQGFIAAELFAAAQRFPDHALVYGSGLDTHPDWVSELSTGRTLFGNTPATLRRVNNPEIFFPLLAELDIPHPETRFTPPATLDGWLLKPGCGEGGKRVGFAAKNRPAADSYYQRHVPGAALSLLFLANGKTAFGIGFNTQWQHARDSQQPFLYAGAINRADLGERQRQAVAAYAQTLTQAFGLVGLNSLDFMHDHGDCWLLEINPRPSATMALYDADYPHGLLAAHIAACSGQLPAQPHPGPVRAQRILYAPRCITIPAGFDWPLGCADIPQAGEMIGAGQPLCSLIAKADDVSGAAALLAVRCRQILSTLTPPAID